MKYRKKPIIIEAMHWDGSIESADKIEEWSEGKTQCYCNSSEVTPFLKIDTLEGSMTALPGDYIIKGIKSEFYPCRPDIFEETYERTE